MNWSIEISYYLTYHLSLVSQLFFIVIAFKTITTDNSNFLSWQVSSLEGSVRIECKLSSTLMFTLSVLFVGPSSCPLSVVILLLQTALKFYVGLLVNDHRIYDQNWTHRDAKGFVPFLRNKLALKMFSCYFPVHLVF